MTEDAIGLAEELVAIPSASDHSNAAITEWLEAWLLERRFAVERLSYTDKNGETKMSLVAHIGEGSGGLGFFSHSDTVPGGDGWEAYTPAVRGGRLIGRGSCDMKGPLAATLAAAAGYDADRLSQPLYIVVTADEEVGYGGARQVIAESETLQRGWPAYGIIAEPTKLAPVYAHKGGIRIDVTAHGRAAHTSTDRGISANFRIAPFLADMAELALLFRDQARFQNQAFDPPTNGFNMVLDDGGCKSNVTAARCTCTLSIRTMPDDGHAEALALVEEKAMKYDLDFEWTEMPYFYSDANRSIVQTARRATGAECAVTVPFGTEASLFQEYLEAVILGPGDIVQAHTVGEWIEVEQITRAVDVYRDLINTICC